MLVIKKCIAVLLFFFFQLNLSSCSNESVDKEVTKPIFKAEMVVTPVKGKLLVACSSQEFLNQLMGHLVKEEKTKASAMFNEFDCFPIPETEKFKVLSVKGDMLEITNIKNSDSIGVWAYTESMQPLK